jgi:hypothetical protein
MKQFKATNDVWLSKALFFEHSTPLSRKKYTPYFTTKDHDHTVDGVTYVSLKALYLEVGDPTEYEFATEYLGGWNHWQAICKSPPLEEWVEECREELKLKLMAEGVRATRKLAAGGNAAAAKELMKKGWLEDKKGRGRPSKEEVEGVRKQMALEDQEHENDVDRMMRH